MISPRALDLAVERGVVTAEQAARLQALQQELAPEPVDEEKLRFVSGFGDVFVTLGLALFLGSIAWFAWVMLALGSWGRAAAAAVIATASWVLAEVFTRRRRMALPSITLVLTFAAAVLAGALIAGGHIAGISDHAELAHPMPHGAAAAVVTVAMGLTAAAAALHYRRFRVPVTIAVGVATLIWGFFGVLVAAAPDVAAAWWRPILFACGLGVFALAMRVDASDPQRLTRRTDVAFWLHLLAAPLIVHTLIGGLIASANGFDIFTAVLVLACFLLLALVAVLVDRRAILVAGLTYAGIAFATLFRHTGLNGTTVPATLLVLGIFVLTLSVGWQPLRAMLLGAVPRKLIQRPPHRGFPSGS